MRSAARGGRRGPSSTPPPGAAWCGTLRCSGVAPPASLVPSASSWEARSSRSPWRCRARRIAPAGCCGRAARDVYVTSPSPPLHPATWNTPYPPSRRDQRSALERLERPVELERVPRRGEVRPRRHLHLPCAAPEGHLLGDLSARRQRVVGANAVAARHRVSDLEVHGLEPPPPFDAEAPTGADDRLDDVAGRRIPLDATLDACRFELRVRRGRRALRLFEGSQPTVLGRWRPDGQLEMARSAEDAEPHRLGRRPGGRPVARPEGEGHPRSASE